MGIFPQEGNRRACRLKKEKGLEKATYANIQPFQKVIWIESDQFDPEEAILPSSQVARFTTGSEDLCSAIIRSPLYTRSQIPFSLLPSFLVATATVEPRQLFETFFVSLRSRLSPVVSNSSVTLAGINSTPWLPSLKEPQSM